MRTASARQLALRRDLPAVGEVGHLDCVGSDALGRRDAVRVVDQLRVSGWVPRSASRDVPTVSGFQRYGYELVEDQRAARFTAMGICGVEELGEERRAEVFEVVRPSRSIEA